uniref:Uncharacterized protein n=1 Tax=Daphnia magna TaxID=35525 RepID=A0A0P5XK06_9CRUS
MSSGNIRCVQRAFGMHDFGTLGIKRYRRRNTTANFDNTDVTVYTHTHTRIYLLYGCYDYILQLIYSRNAYVYTRNG